MVRRKKTGKEKSGKARKEENQKMEDRSRDGGTSSMDSTVE